MLAVLLASLITARLFPRYRWLTLLLASYLFYFAWQPLYSLILAFTTLSTYYCANRMAAQPDFKWQKRWMWVSVSISVGVLFFFKYFESFNSVVHVMLHKIGFNYTFSEWSILLPVGISFYTFQALSYTFDVYYGDRVPEKHLGHFATYIAFFPQLLSGPIERSGPFLAQLKLPYSWDEHRIILGLRRFVWGFFKKVVVADRIGVLVDYVYDQPLAFEGFVIPFVTVIYAFQVYFDFSGYTDMAIGTARILGINLTENFNYPFSSRSVTEFWRRWHISLGNWLRDYLYNPISFSLRRYKRSGVYITLFLTFLICGIWHGARFTFIIFGLLQAAALIIEAALIDKRKLWSVSRWKHLYSFASLLATFGFILFSDVFFRCSTVTEALMVFKNIFLFDSAFSDLVKFIQNFTPSRILFSLSLLVFVLVGEKKLNTLADGKWTLGPVLNMLVYAAIVASILLFGYWGAVQFVYFKF